VNMTERNRRTIRWPPGTTKSEFPRFIPVSEAAALAQEIDGFPAGVIPLGEDGSGNYFYVEPQSGSICFWDHGIEGQDEIVATDVSAFVDKLAPFDQARVTLAPGQVRHVWVDPIFSLA
jgi:hypothetical protein